jgi:hypothetical protein
MLKGDLSAKPLAPVLLDLAASGATGSVILNRPDGGEAQLFMRGGLVCGISAPDQRTDLGAKLVSSGVLAPEALSDALEAQRTDLSAWNLGELLIHLGYVEEDVIQEFITEGLHEALWDLLQWADGRWKFRKNAKIREDIRPPHAVVELLETLRERGYEWEEISSVVNSPEAIPVLSARGDGAPETTLDSDAWSMLCKIDGVRSVAELANDCGYTLFEAGQVLVTLVDAGLVDMSDDVDDDSADVYGASALAQALAGRGGSESAASATAPQAGDDALTRLARLASDVTSHGATAATTNPLQLDVMAAQLSGGAALTVPLRRNAETFAASMGRVSGALADALGPAPQDTEEETSLIEVRKRPKPTREAAPIDGEQELERRRRLRAAASAELASAQADAESLRPDHDVNARVEALDAPPKLVDLDTERARVAAREAEEASRHASEDAARRAAEEFAKAATEQAVRHAAELADAQSADQTAKAAADQAQREAAEQAGADAARLDAGQAAAEQAAAELAARQLAEQQAAAAAAAEQAQREAAERAAAEAAQAAADQAAAEQAAAVQAAAEQAQREAAERAAAEAAQAAADQAAAEQAAAVQAAAEQAAQEAAERSAADSREAAARAEAETALIAAQAQAAAADEAGRLAQEAQRVADEQAALAADTAAKHAAIDEHDFAAAALLADQAAQASAMLAELHHSASETLEVVISVVPDPEPERQPEPEPAPVGASGEDADTAALLRELSSLGDDDDRPVMTASAPRGPRPNQVDPKKAKKKIGLFGL